jgi:hypothetical protein
MLFLNFRLQYDPVLIPQLAAKYLRTPYKRGTAADADRVMEEAGWRLVNGPFDLEDAKTVVGWKSARRMDQFKLNRPERVEAAIREAIEATKAGDVERAVKTLAKLAGVKLKMASAILTAMFPTLYTVCDFRASHAVGVKDSSGLKFFVAYLAACREMAVRYGVSLRDFDRANWQWSKDQSKTKEMECVGVCCANENGPGLPVAA